MGLTGTVLRVASPSFLMLGQFTMNRNKMVVCIGLSV